MNTPQCCGRYMRDVLWTVPGAKEAWFCLACSRKQVTPMAHANEIVMNVQLSATKVDQSPYCTTCRKRQMYDRCGVCATAVCAWCAWSGPVVWKGDQKVTTQSCRACVAKENA